MKRTAIIFALFSIATFLSTGCTYTVKPIDATLPQKPLIEKLPIAIGVYYSEELRSYIRVESLPKKPDISLRFIMGPPSKTLFDEIVLNLFEEVSLIQSRPPLTKAKPKIQAIIEPKITALSADSDIGVMWIQVDISYNIKLYDIKGVEIASWSISGSGYSDYGLGLNVPVMAGKATQAAIHDVASTFMVEFFKHPKIPEWLQRIGITASK